MPDDREFRLNNLGELEQFLGGDWIKVPQKEQSPEPIKSPS